MITGLNILTDKLINTRAAILVTNKYIYALMILAITVILAKLCLFIIEKYIQRWTKKTRTNVDDLIIDAMRWPSYILILILGIRMSLEVLALPEKIYFYISHTFSTFSVVIVIYILIKVFDIIIGVWGRMWTKRTHISIDDDLLPLLHKTSKVIFFIIAFLFLLHIWGINITGFLAGLGIAGIAIGFAVKDSLANIFGGVFLILDKNFKVGDRVKLESGEMGDVIDIGLRSTRIRTFDNEMIIIPNGILANQKLHNFSKPDTSLRVKVMFCVEYGNDIGTVKNLVIDAVKKVDKVAKMPEPEVWFIEMGDFALNFQCNAWVDNYMDAMAVKVACTTAIYNALNRARINIPFPTRTLYMKK
ncbi:MAG: mechanosensitive ion channel family protein, partial [Candidatus Woesearchaeota archaeon]